MAAAARQVQRHSRVWDVYVPMWVAHPRNPDAEFWKQVYDAKLRGWAAPFCQILDTVYLMLLDNDGEEVIHVVARCLMPRPYTRGELEAEGPPGHTGWGHPLPGITFEVS